ncbi:MAG TPA: RNA polymerase recycling motor HelD [Bacillus sp. (in: firmicutes)]|uniref:RNA polymerase recycling motor HelD n=1 Tax=Bacillus litorisediminis TaxID=2922713 RepID=UPI001FAC183B|nr:RNA polymerase recycling motor HelD [Bacillus litorisediminis]HWO74942.1 RNA polymerase recycling motor HelD [Bacillus sp. (in: firmicutes)]
MTEIKKDWKKEQERIDSIVDVIDEKVSYLEQNTGHIKDDILEIRKNFWNDVTINLDEPDDIIETFVSIKQQAEMLSERERSQGQVQKLLKTFWRLKDSPYFGRVDFREEGESKSDSIYVGIASLLDHSNENFLIYDWRAPISSLYYDYGLGTAAYQTPGDGQIQGEINLKRQYIIRSSVLKGMFDTGVTIGDELLQEVLGNNASTQMKSIVATIQKEQNEIIRSEGTKYLIVQGVAGSGKTSAALQRVAYLLYRYRNILQAEQIMLFSPNPMFNSYVSTVLPELGEENMQQSTLQQYIDHRLGNRYQVEDPFEQMEYILSDSNDQDFYTRKEAISYKASLLFKNYIDNFVRSLSDQGLIFKNITFRKRILISARQIEEKFYSLDKAYSIPNRISIVSEWIKKELKKLARLERKKEWVEQEVQLLDKEDYLEAFKQLQKKRKDTEETFDDFEQEQLILAKEVVNKRFKPLLAKVKRLEFIDHMALYKSLFNHDLKISDESLPVNWVQICEYTLNRLKRFEILYEDSVPFLYLQDLIEGRKSNTMIRHIVIDEAQDYSPFQFAYIKQLFPYSYMTILGDRNQAILSHTMNAPTILSDEFYEKTETKQVILNRSYRSTKEIVEFTRELIPFGDQIEPFNRSGKKPVLTKVHSREELNKRVVERIKIMESEGHQTIAIICKTAHESAEVYQALKHQVEARLIKKGTLSYEKGILVIPAYLAKGIEFDGVILYNISQDVYRSEDERKLLYTASTRAMHELHLFSLGKISFLLDDVSEQRYQIHN